jgi:hypothetical protein
MDLMMMERVGDRWEKMEGSCSTGQSPQWAVVPVEEEGEGEGEGEGGEEEEEEEEEEDPHFAGPSSPLLPCLCWHPIFEHVHSAFLP